MLVHTLATIHAVDTSPAARHARPAGGFVDRTINGWARRGRDIIGTSVSSK